MRSRLLLGCVVLVSVVAAGVLALQASGTSTVAVSCGDVITTSITVDNDLTDCPGDGLVVGASGITINLNGHTIDGDDAGDDGIDNTGGFDNVKLLDGTITDFEHGVDIAGNADKNQLIGLEIRSGVTAIAISFDSDSAQVKDNRLLENSERGISIGGSIGHKIDSNRIVANGGDGIVPGSNNQLTKNVIALNGDDGVYIGNEDGNALTQNVIAGNGNDGVFISDGAGENVVKQNRISRNAGAGVHLDAHAAPGNLVQQNLLFGNGAQGILLTSADGNTLKQNDVHGTNGDGILVDAATENTILDGNFVSANAADGIDVNDADGGTLIKKNRVDANGDRGIEAVSGVDGGGNKAAGNINATQCQVVVCS